MKYCIPLFMFFLPFYVSGQSYLSARIGLGATNASPGSFNGNFKLGFAGGVGYEKFLSDHFSLSSDVMYKQLGFAMKFDMRNSMGGSLGEGKFKAGLNYVAMPIKAGYYVGDKVNFFGKAGIVPSFLVSAKDRTPMNNASDTGIEYRDVKSTDNYKRFDLAGLLEVGAVCEINSKFYLFGSFQYQHSITSYRRAGVNVTTYELRHYAFTLSAGVKTKL